MKFDDFCIDLQDLVMLFAWNVPMRSVKNTFAVLSELESMDVPWFFLRGRVWSWHYHRHMPSPTIIFMPLEYFSGSGGFDQPRCCVLLFVLVGLPEARCEDFWTENAVGS